MSEAWTRFERTDAELDELAWPPEPPMQLIHGEGRRVEVLRRIELWSTLKVSLVLYFCVLVAFLTVGVGIWNLGRATGAIGGLEHLIEDLGFGNEGSYHSRGDEILKISAVIGPILVVLGSFATVAGVALFNCASRLTGGVRLTVSAEEA
jgi:hypothetical protein